MKYTSILEQLEKDAILESIGSGCPINIKEEQFCFDLTLRPSVLSDTFGSEWDSNKPISKLHIVNEYWNLDKVLLMNKIEQSFTSDSGRERRCGVKKIFDLLKEECGIDFSKEGKRLGDFEDYVPGKYMDAFAVKSGDNNSIILPKNTKYL